MATTIELSAATARTSAIPMIGLASRKPASASASATKKPVNAPNMNTSPWAKLIISRTP
jgi:hypothetical protein